MRLLNREPPPPDLYQISDVGEEEDYTVREEMWDEAEKHFWEDQTRKFR